MAISVEAELPGAYIDGLFEDAVPAAAGKTPILLNADPEPDETRVAQDTDIALEIATIDSTGTIDLSTVQVYVNGALAFAGGAFAAAFGGARSAFSNPQSDVLRINIDPQTDFDSQAVVLVRVVAQATGDTGVLDTTYLFTLADTSPPRILHAEAVDLQRVRVTFDEGVVQGDGLLDSATNPANWQLDRYGDYLTPLVSAKVVAVEPGFALTTVDLITDIPLTPGGLYRLTASLIEDAEGNVIDTFNTTDFTGWLLPFPAEREFNLYKTCVPEINKREDALGDLLRFVLCIQEVANLLLYDIDQFISILDPDTAPEVWVDAMLEDLGNPFTFDLSLTDKRRLANVLVDMYKLKGTAVGIVDVIRFFLRIDVEVDQFNSSTGWVLGESRLGDGTILGTSNQALLYSFEVVAAQVLTATEREQISAIVRYMKPAHTHFVRLREPAPPPEVLNHLVLGVSRLGENWILH